MALLTPYGDHFFSCQRFSKLLLSNSIRNALWAICHATSSLAGLTTSHNDVFLEPRHLSHSFPSSRPADVGLRLTPTYISDPMSIPFKFLAIDVSVAPTPPFHDDPTKNAASALHNHLSVEASKFLGRDTKHCIGQMLIHELTSHGTSILPFSIDPFCGLGPFATSLLFCSTPTPASPSLPPTASTAHALASSSSKVFAMLPKADAQWHTSHPRRLYGKSFRTPSPSAWAKQLLGLNFILASSKHYSLALAKQSAPLTPASLPPPYIPGQHSTHYFSRLTHEPHPHPPNSSLLT